MTATTASPDRSATSALYDYDQQDASGATCTAHAWAKVPAPLTPSQRRDLKARAAELLKARGAVLVAHYYVDGDLQDLGELELSVPRDPRDAQHLAPTQGERHVFKRLGPAVAPGGDVVDSLP